MFEKSTSEETFRQLNLRHIV